MTMFSNRTLLFSGLLLAAMNLGIAAQEPPKKLEREILGDELKFGREAAKFGLWNEAIFRWEKIVKGQPQNAQAVNNLAIAYEYVGNYEKARDLYQEALNLDEDSRDIKRNYKRFLSFFKRHQRQLEREKRAREAKQRIQKQAEDTNDAPEKGGDS